MKKYLLKAIFVGDILVGKTCLLNRFYNNSYNEYTPTRRREGNTMRNNE